MNKEQIERIINELEKEGRLEEAKSLRNTQLNLELIEEPQGFFSNAVKAVKDALKVNIDQFFYEVDDTKEAFKKISQSLSNEEEISEQDREFIREQLIDLFKVVPASVIAIGNTAIPIPGAALLTPMILKKLNLLPSRWVEHSILENLKAQKDHLKNINQLEAAETVSELIEELNLKANLSERISDKCKLLSYWDEDNDNEWSEEELLKYNAELKRIKEIASTEAKTRTWYCQIHENLFGPCSIDLFFEDGAEIPLDMLVSYKGETGWISMLDLVKT